jgi:hypothetical protein
MSAAMRRFARHLFTICSALSLLLCFLLVTFWVRSYLIGDYVQWYDPPKLIDVQSRDGLMRAGVGELTSRQYPPQVGWEGTFWPFDRQIYTFHANLRSGTVAGFRYERWQHQSPNLRGDARIITCPYWCLVLLSAVLPTVMGLRWYRARRRPRPGRCPNCGYDLRASPDRCPECGTVCAIEAVKGGAIG